MERCSQCLAPLEDGRGYQHGDNDLLCVVCYLTLWRGAPVGNQPVEPRRRKRSWKPVWNRRLG
jgi:hypothetical protein